MSFGPIAHIYDRFNDYSVYQFWLDFTLNSRDTKPERVLDLACGTGLMTDLLAPFVGQITGLDIDQQMLAVAEEAVGHLPNVDFVQGDMTQLELADESYDMITCYFDSLCFLSSYQDLVQAFSQAYRVLEEGGVYLFDVWTVFQIKEAFKDFQYFDYDDEAALLWESEVETETLSVTHYLQIFESNNGIDYQRHQVALEERTYPLKEYVQALELAGFQVERIEVFINEGQDYYDSHEELATDRWFFRCYK